MITPGAERDVDVACDGMLEPVETATSEDAFRTAFRELLRKATATPLLELNPLAAHGLCTQIAQWPEAEPLHQIALSNAALRPLASNRSGQAVDDRVTWIRELVLSAATRYRELTDPEDSNAKPLSHGRAVARIASEVVRWAKLDPVPMRTTTLVHGLRTEGVKRFRVNETTLLRPSTEKEWAAIFTADTLPMQPLCLEQSQLVPRQSPVPLERPVRFVQALQLIVNSPMYLGDTSARPAVPAFGGWPGSGGRLVGQPPPTLQLTTTVSYAQLRRAKRVAAAFSDLGDSGFDLALVLYGLFLHRRGLRREQAVNIAIALENLYLVGVRQESTYRFQLRVVRFARYLAKTERLDIEAAKRLYDARSVVVHGDYGPKHQKAVEDAIQLLNTAGAGLVRSTLLQIVSPRQRRILLGIGREIEDAIAS